MDKYNVYVVDNDPSILHAIRSVLHDTYNVEIFTEATRCLSEIQDNPCDLLITDIHMPQMDGLALTEEFKKYLPSTPVLILTGYGDVPTAKQAISRGANDFLEKPFDRLQFLETIQRLLSHYGLLVEFVKKYSLSRMQFVILQHILAGRCTKEMAYLMKRSVRTLESHRYKMMKKTGVNNVVELLTKPHLIRYMSLTEAYD